MKAMVLKRVAPLSEVPEPLSLIELPDPEPARGEISVRVAACGVCHTELDEIEGRLEVECPVILGHEIVGYVEKLGSEVVDWEPGDRVGIGWIHSSTGEPDENLHPDFKATGRDRPGGYAERLTVPSGYAYRLPNPNSEETQLSDAETAPLLCAGAIGHRALKLLHLENGQPVGLTGFGGSGHIVLQLIQLEYPKSAIYVFARDPGERAFALELGAVWAGATEERAPEKLRGIIDTTPAWKPVVAALSNLAPGGRLVINAIRKEPDDQESLLELDYAEHLWLEREIKTVANITHFDIAEFLELAAKLRVRPAVETYPLEEANRALRELKRGGLRGAKVLVP